MSDRDELIRAHPEFYRIFQPYIVRDKKVLNKLRRQLPTQPYHGSWKELTGTIAKEYKNKELTGTIAKEYKNKKGLFWEKYLIIKKEVGQTLFTYL